MKILVAEDDRKYAERLQTVLTRSDDEVVLCTSTPALRKFVDRGEKIDFALLDLRLGVDEEVEDGMENISLVRRAYPHVPILLLTAHLMESWFPEARHSGADAILKKPLKIDGEYVVDVLKPQIRALVAEASNLDPNRAAKQLKSLSENDFIERIIVPVLQRKGFLHVAPVGHHGPGEFGRDIGPFYRTDPFGHRDYYAVQVKAGNVNANAKSPDNVNHILNQVDAALTKQFVGADGVTRNVSQVYLMVSGHIKPGARQLLDDAIKKGRSLVVMDATKIIELLRADSLLYLLERAATVKRLRILPVVVRGEPDRNTSWEGLLREVLIKKCNLPEVKKDEICRRLMARSGAARTLVGGGFAMPHVYDTQLDKHIVVLCSSEAGIRWRLGKRQRVLAVTITLYAHDENNVTGTIRRTLDEICKEEPESPAAANGTWESLMKRIADRLARELRPHGFKVTKSRPKSMRLG